MGNKRSLTIVELLIVIALLAAMASILVPLIADSLNERAFESAADVTGEQLVLARAHAQSTGEPVEVRYHVSSAQVEARLFTPWAPGLDQWPMAGMSGAAQSKSDETDQPTPGVRTEAQPKNCTIAEPWASRALSNGVRIVNHRPGAKTAGPASGAGGADDVLAQLGLPGDSDADIRLAVFMPDGSALMGAPVWFNDEDGRIGKLTINPWTGLPVFERVAQADDEIDSDAAGRNNPGDDDTEATPVPQPAQSKGAPTGREGADRSVRNPK